MVPYSGFVRMDVLYLKSWWIGVQNCPNLPKKAGNFKYLLALGNRIDQNRIYLGTYPDRTWNPQYFDLDLCNFNMNIQTFKKYQTCLIFFLFCLPCRLCFQTYKKILAWIYNVARVRAIVGNMEPPIYVSSCMHHWK